MDKLIVGVFITMFIIAIASLLYFIFRPQQTVYTFGNYDAQNASDNPSWYPPGFKVPLNYICKSDEDCANGAVCDPANLLCKVPNYSPCKTATDCIESSFCNRFCYPRDTVPVGYNNPGDALNMSAPCPDRYSTYDGTLIVNGISRDAYICRYSGGEKCTNNNQCTSGACATQGSPFCNGKSIKCDNTCIDKAGEGIPCINGTNCASGFCYIDEDQKGYCQNTQYKTSNNTIGMNCSQGMKCGKGYACVGGICTIPGSGLLEGCSPTISCPGSMVCYQTPVINYDPDTGNITGYDTPYQLCNYNSTNCTCNFYTTINSQNTPQYGVVDPNLILETDLIKQTCISNMIPASSGDVCIPKNGQPAFNECSLSTPVNGQKLYLFVPQQNISGSERIYPQGGIIGSDDFIYQPIPINNNIVFGKIQRVKVCTYNNGVDINTFYEMIFIITDLSIYWGDMQFKNTNGVVDRSIYNYDVTSNNLNIVWTNTGISGNDISFLYDTSGKNNGQNVFNGLPKTRIYVLQNENGYSNIYEVTFNSGKFTKSSTPSLSHMFNSKYLSVYYNGIVKTDELNDVSPTGSYYLVSNDSTSIYTTPSKNSYDLSTGGPIVLTIMPVNTSGSSKSNTWYYNLYMGIISSKILGSSNTLTGAIYYYFSINGGNAIINPYFSVPNYEYQYSSQLKYDVKWGFDQTSYLSAGVDKNYYNYNNVAVIASVTADLSSSPTNALHYISGSIQTAVPGYFTDGTTLSISPHELIIFTDTYCG